MTITTTRRDCTRDNRACHLPNASTLGFGCWKAKRGNWIVYESDDGSKHCGRVIARVLCEGAVYLEIAQASESFDSAFVRWVKPEMVRQCRASPPYTVFDFFRSAWKNPDDIHAMLAYGVSDMRDQLAARAALEKESAS